MRSRASDFFRDSLLFRSVFPSALSEMWGKLGTVHKSWNKRGYCVN